MKKLSLIFFTALIAIGLFAPIATTINLKTQKIVFSNSVASAQTISTGTAADIANNGSQDYNISATPEDDKGLQCSGSFFSSLSDMGCQIGVFFVYNIFYSGTSWLASITAGLADNLLWQSLQSWTYQNDFILTGWTVMRDMANISFIAGLLYAAFLLMSGNDGSGKKVVYMVIVLALGINFSLFFTRLMIDGGNILARSIYQNIDVVNISGANTHETEVGSKKQISAGLVQIMNPQRLLQDDDSPGGAVSPLAAGNISIFLFLFIFAGIVNILMMFMFIKIGLSFLGRTVGLMLLMIMVPITVFAELLPVKKMMPKKYLITPEKLEKLYSSQPTQQEVITNTSKTLVRKALIFLLLFPLLLIGGGINGLIQHHINSGQADLLAIGFVVVFVGTTLLVALLYNQFVDFLTYLKNRKR